MLLNPWGLFFDEITASSLVKVKLDGSDLEAAKSINKAGFTIHSAVLGARDDVVCALHTHTRAGMAVSAMADGLLPLSQHALRFYNRLAYHDYEGIATDLDERQRLVADLGGHYAMILRNHGLLGCGRSVAEAFSVVFYLEKSCQSQLDAMSSGAELTIPAPEVCEQVAQQFESVGPMGERDWAAYLRQLDAEEPDYRG
jgi:ribulose-5-phosphate 4-epimerase/fuculose-1-phosphate aldolase